jgi:hypothetical protein
MPCATGNSKQSGHTENGEGCERYGMTTVLCVLGIVFGALGFVVLRSLVVNEDVDEL